jgi:mono/diheme cytochrome c family protein
MLDETPSQWVSHLEHPNGWWRDTAQKLLVLKGDKSVVPALEKLAQTSANPLTRMHALWTLEGLEAATPRLVSALLKDAHPQVRVSAVRVSESIWKAGDQSLQPAVIALGKDPDPTVALQVLLTGKLLNWEKWTDAANRLIAESPSKGFQELGKMALSAGLPSYPKDFSPQDLALLKEGETIFRELCFTCHGHDGKGMPLAGAAPGVTLAPPLAGSKTVKGPIEGLVSVLLHGIAGPLDGKTYEAQMVPLGTNPDRYLAAIGSYVRNSFSNRGSILSLEEVARIRQATKDRTAAWTQAELVSALPNPLNNRSQWKVSASASGQAAAAATDGKGNTGWSTGAPQVAGQWFQVELPQEQSIVGVRLEVPQRSKVAAKQVKVELSGDGQSWTTVVAKAGSSVPNTELNFPMARARFVRITQLGTGPDPWAIHELHLIQPGSMFPLANR